MNQISAVQGQSVDRPLHGIPFSDAVRVWARIAALSFGGPAGQIAVMHRILVEEKRWIGENRFLHALNYCMLLPGPEAQQLAVYIGWLLHQDEGRAGRGHALRSARPPRHHGLELDLRRLRQRRGRRGPVLRPQGGGAGDRAGSRDADRPARAQEQRHAWPRGRRVRRDLRLRRAVPFDHSDSRPGRLLRRACRCSCVPDRRQWPWQARQGGSRRGDRARRKRACARASFDFLVAARLGHLPRALARAGRRAAAGARSGRCLHEHRRVLLEDGGGHLRRRLRRAGLRRAAGGRDVRLAAARRDAGRAWPCRDDARAADHGDPVRGLPWRPFATRAD